MTSEGEAAFSRILGRNDALPLMLAAFQDGNLHAKCYALVALRELNRELFGFVLATMRLSPLAKIRTMSGCLGSENEPEEILSAIEAGAYARFALKQEGKR